MPIIRVNACINIIKSLNRRIILKKYTVISYIALILIIFVFGFWIYKVSAKNNSGKEIKEKTYSELKYLENELQNLFNEINNIKFENYTISATNIEENNEQSEESNSESSGNSKDKQSESQTQSEESSGGNTSDTEKEKTTNKQYQLKKEGILTKNKEIDWNQIKNDVEKIYTVLYSTTIDLYEIVENKEDITNFNKEYDNLTKAVKEENKKETLKQLSVLYDFLAKLVDSCSEKEKDRVVIKTKNYIFKAYSVLENDEWQIVLDNVNMALQEFNKITTNISDNSNGHQYNINKSYIMINELKKSADFKDKEVFLIKYKNLLEELENV